ncbi:hypothetical protein Q9L58_009381 [Maublancomyces gigas]|uniref:Uncharacterized protein n=1 Tax=Discina gigas TaxID=1032678 RepID=A0ABR3G7U4_9PEZI
MPSNRKKRRHLKQDHIGSSPDSAIVLRPPKNHKGRVIINIWSRRFTACYETEFCPDCPRKHVRKTLKNFCNADKSYFAAARWLTLEGFNDDTLNVSFNPNSTVEITNFLALIKKRDRQGGKITLRIVRKGQAVSFWIVFALIAIITVTMGMTTLARKHEGINATFMSILTNVFSGIVNEVMNAIYKF